LLDVDGDISDRLSSMTQQDSAAIDTAIESVAQLLLEAFLRTFSTKAAEESGSGGPRAG
jgi:hypothetical protein